MTKKTSNANALTQDQVLRMFNALLAEFRGIESDIMATKILALTVPGRFPGVAQYEMPDHIPAAGPSTLSRYIQDWTEWDKNRKPGMDYIVQKPDPNFRRRNLLYTTPKGQSFLQRLTTIANHAITDKE